MKHTLLIIVAIACYGTSAGEARAEKYPDDGTSRSRFEESSIDSSFADAEELLVEEASVSLSSLEDAMFDFEVYAAEQRTGWFIIWMLDDGSTQMNGGFLSQKGANDWLIRALLGGWEPSNTVGYQIVELPLNPEWILVETLATRAAANELAALLESLGLLVEIRRVSTLQMTVETRTYTRSYYP